MYDTSLAQEGCSSIHMKFLFKRENRWREYGLWNFISIFEIWLDMTQ